MTTKESSERSWISSTAAPNQGAARAFALIPRVHRGVKSQDLGGQFTGPKREIRWSPNVFKYDQARRRFVEWAQNEIAVVPDFHKRILFSDEAHFWLNGYVNKQNCCIWSEANPQVYVETPLHPEKLTVWCALWAGGILLHKR
ncbi:hypothetical protein TNCV_2727581 [Trichonephila clavipes]|nr:hypothetical protein TNCV_2727581 [Trichonephila clavipes]